MSAAAVTPESIQERLGLVGTPYEPWRRWIAGVVHALSGRNLKSHTVSKVELAGMEGDSLMTWGDDDGSYTQLWNRDKEKPEAKFADRHMLAEASRGGGTLRPFGTRVLLWHRPARHYQVYVWDSMDMRDCLHGQTVERPIRPSRPIETSDSQLEELRSKLPDGADITEFIDEVNLRTFHESKWGRGTMPEPNKYAASILRELKTKLELEKVIQVGLDSEGYPWILAKTGEQQYTAYWTIPPKSQIKAAR